MSEVNLTALKNLMYDEDFKDLTLCKDENMSLNMTTLQVEVVPPSSNGQAAVMQEINLVKLAYYYIQGYNVSDLSHALDINENAIRTALCSSKFQAVIEVMTKEVIASARTFLSAASVFAVKTLLSSMKSKDESVKLKAATDLLDRVGLKSPQQIQLTKKLDSIEDMSESELLELVNNGMSELSAKRKVSGRDAGLKLVGD